MRTYVLTQLSDASLSRNLEVAISRDRTTTAEVLAHIAEFDARRLYLPAGFPSMHAYCVGRLRLSEDCAYKRIQASRAARQFPAIFSAVADGRLHLAAVCLLAPHLRPENAGELLTAATHRTKADIELMVAQRFPRTEMMTLVQTIPASPTRQNKQLAPGQVEFETRESAAALAGRLAPGQVAARVSHSNVAPIAHERFALHMTIGKDTYDKLRYVQELMSHRIPSGDIAQVIDRALDALVCQLEKRKFAATERPQPGSRRSSTDPRHIPAHVKRAVRERDQGQCTFVSETGQRCGSRKFLEYDHIEPVARGGQATVEGIRLRCRGHNQYEAECVFGAGFMNEKREDARLVAADARTRATKAETARKAAAVNIEAAKAEAEARTRIADERVRAQAEARENARELTACLSELRFRATEVRRAVEFCETLPEATLEGRVRAALRFLRPNTRPMSLGARI